MAKKQHNKPPRGTTARTYNPKTFIASCASCGSKVIVPCKPDSDKSLFCVDCFQKNKN